MKTKKEPVEKMLAACVGYAHGTKTYKQVWYAIRGEKNKNHITHLKDRALHDQLFILWLDFFTHRGDEEEMVRNSILRIADYVTSQTKHLKN